MRHLRGWNTRGLGVLGIAAMLVVAGCGQADTPTATLEIASVPAADIYVNGVNQGSSPATLTLAQGDHKVELRSDKFASFETGVTLAANESKKIDASLTALDPSAPEVISRLAQSQGVDVAPFVAPETTRGRSGKRQVAVLLWPSRDVRKDGLVNYAIEADETYAGDATLEFRHGRKVLYRESFSPETITTVRSIPAEVQEAVRVGRKITWGLYFEDSRPAIKTSFRIVRRPKADRQIAKMSHSRHMARQPEITRELMKAAVLENNRLYSEALVMNLEIAAAHPNSTQPFRGIVTTLRRLDGEGSELWAFVAPHVSGKGGHASKGISARSGSADMGITAWMPTPEATGVTSPTAPEGMDVSRPEQPGTTEQPGTEQPGTEQPGTTAQPGVTVEPATGIEQMQQHIEATQRAADQAQAEADAAHAHADELEQAARDAADGVAQAEAAAQQAEATAAAAREAIEQAGEPTDAQAEALREATEAANAANANAESVRNAAEGVQNAAAEARQAAQNLTETAQRQAAEAESLRSALEQAQGVPVPGGNADDGQGVDNSEARQQTVEQAQTRADETRAAYDAARQALEAAQQAGGENPTAEHAEALAEAHEAFQAAAQSAYEAQEHLEAAQAAAREIGDQVQNPVTR